MAEALLDVSPYAVYLHLLGLKTPAGNLAPASVMAGYQRYQARRAIYAGCGALAAGAMIWTGVNLYQAMQLRGEAEDAARQTATYMAQYQEITRQFPQTPTTAENLQRAVEIAQKLRASTHSPQRMMALVSRAMEASPSIIIRDLGWKYGNTDIDTGDGTKPGDAGQQPAPGPGATPSATPQVRRESALIDGAIRPFRGDYRSAIVTINGFASRLAEEPDVAEVRVVRLPLNVNPSLSLSGNTLDNPEQTANATAEFRLLVRLKPNS
jgi:hypothetical protein